MLLGRCTINTRQTFAGNSAVTLNHLTGDHELFDALLRRQRIHCVQKQLFENHHQATRADFSFDCLLGNGFQGIFSELELNVVKIKFLLILLDQGVLWFSENLDQRAFIQLVQYAADWQASHKLRNQTKTNQVLGLNSRERFSMAMAAGFYFRLEPERLIAQPAPDHFLQAYKRAAADKKYVRGIDQIGRAHV